MTKRSFAVVFIAATLITGCAAGRGGSDQAFNDQAHEQPRSRTSRATKSKPSTKPNSRRVPPILAQPSLTRPVGKVPSWLWSPLPARRSGQDQRSRVSSTL